MSSTTTAREKEILQYWREQNIFEKSVQKDAPKGEYVFYDGPPFATGLPHYGHLVASIMKDVVPRYQTMRGFRVERRWGWDCHGLPIENIVEKELGSKSKKDIEATGVAKFNELCRSKVLEYAEDWKKYIKKLGRWVDMENGYRTMDTTFMESVWWVFKELWGKGLVYKDYRSMHICPRCETTLSQSEVAEGYKDVKDLSAVVKFKIKDITNSQIGHKFTNDDQAYILAWTTTPWTLIGNVALAVGKNIDYSLIEEKKDGKIERYILATDLINRVFKKELVVDNLIVGHVIIGSPKPESPQEEYKLLKRFKGNDLVGLEYEPLFDYYSSDEEMEYRENGWKIYAGDFVTTEEGTGVVHIAPAFGEDDMKLGRENKLPFVQHVDMDGYFKEEVKDFPGLNVKPKDDVMATDVEIIKYLAHNDLLFSKAKYEHSYPHCWRCDTPLLNYATSSWFVKVAEMKERLLKNAEKINWSPEHIKAGRFGKWLLGARDWSISRQRYWASVIPIWECGCGERIVIGSIAELEKLSGEKVSDLHKHIVDEITFKCAKCQSTMKRIPDVFDCWFESGSMPYAQMHYPFENKEKFENNFPAEFIAEGADQTRAWFYYLHVLAAGVKDTEAFKNVIVNGIVLAEDGKKMSKKLKNYPDPMEIFNKYGADALRYYLLTSPVMLADTLCFSEKGVKEALQKVNMLLWNVVKFYGMYQGEKSELRSQKLESDNILDKWILARLNQLIEEVTENMDKYNLPKATRPIVEFIDDLSTWYLRRSRDRFKGEDETDKKAALATTGFVLTELSKVIAPFMPFLAEQVWQAVTGHDFKDENKSVHLESWPIAENRKQKIDDRKILDNMAMVRKIVEMALAKRDEAGIKIRQPLRNLEIRNWKLGKENWDQYLELLLKSEINVESVSYVSGEGDLEVVLDTEINEDLKQKGIKRELVRAINNMRRDMGLTISDRVTIKWKSGTEIAAVIEKYKDELRKDTLADEITAGDGIDGGKEIKINGDEVKIGIQKL